MRKRSLLWIVAVVFAGFLAFRLYQELAGADASAVPGGKGKGGGGQLVEIASPAADTITERVSLVGSLRAKQRVEVTPKVSGRLVEIRVDRGDLVRAGQVLAQLEDDEARQQVRRAEAMLQVARASVAQREAELKSVQVELNRYQNLERDGVVSAQQLEQSETRVLVSEAQVNLAKASVAQAEAELEELRIRLSQSEVVSPLTGIVAQRYVDPGALVSSNTPIVLILDLSHMVIIVAVPEREINKIHVGNTANVAVDAFAGEDFVGRVVRISPLLDAQTRTAPVEIQLDNPDGRLKAEMFARVDLDLTSERRALLVSRNALTYRDNRPGVFVVEADRALFRPIETGLNVDSRIEVVSGLTEADTIVTQGANLLKNGDAVRIVPAEGEKAP